MSNKATFDKSSPLSKSQHFRSRRSLLQQASSGFGGIALAGLLAQQSSHGSDDPIIDTGGVDHPAKAKHVIFCYMSGGVSHVDSFDPKPKLKELHQF